jgi:uncharacterized protein YndB with AHSA1/START domain
MNKCPSPIRLHRFIRTRRDQVFGAWTQPEVLSRWFAPAGWSVTRAAIDLRVGGAFAVGMRKASDRDETGVLTGEYETVVTDELLVFSWGWSGDPDLRTRVTVRLSDVEGGVELSLTHEQFTTAEARARHEAGWRDTLDQLAAMTSAEPAE